MTGWLRSIPDRNRHFTLKKKAIMSKKPRNIIILCIDALRFDCIGVEDNKALLEPYGVDGLVDTPNLDSLATQGTRFSQAVSAANITTPSIASMMTGMFTPRHGVRQLFRNKLHSSMVTLAQVLGQNGYVTIDGDEHRALPALDIMRGFDHSHRATDEALWKTIRDNKDRNMFLFLHYMDVHDPYVYSPFEPHPDTNADYNEALERLVAQENLTKRKEDYPYQLTYLDIVQSMFNRGDIGGIFNEYIMGVNKFDCGRLVWTLDQLQELNLLEDSLVIITSDHGEGPGKNTFNHCIELYDSVVRVPLIIIYPGIIPEKKTISQQVRSVDIFPTVISLSGGSVDNLNLPYDLDGADLLPVISGEDTADRDAFFEIWAHSGSGEGVLDMIDKVWVSDTRIDPGIEWFLYQRGLRTPGYKCIIQGYDQYGAEIYDLKDDADFVREAYWAILRRAADEGGARDFLDQLKTHKITRHQLIEILMNSDEYRDLTILYDIEKNPHENSNIYNRGRFDEAWKQFQIMQEKIEMIESTSAGFKPEPVISQSNEDKQKIEAHLKSLGYL